MRRIIGSVPRSTLYVLLFAGCADNDSGSGFSATQSTDGTQGAATSGSTGADTDGSSEGFTPTTGAGMTGMTGTTSTTGMTSMTSTTGGVSAGTTAEGTNGSPSTGAVDTGETDGSSTTQAGETDTTAATTGEDTAGAPSFMVDIWPIFDDRCSCHGDANGAGKLRLAMEDAYTNLVDKPSIQVPEMLLVKPGSAMDSYLWHKLNDTQDDVGGKGKRMPPSGKLKMAELDLIQQWIDGGAKP
jgi:hypothetical protein